MVVAAAPAPAAAVLRRGMWTSVKIWISRWEGQIPTPRRCTVVGGRGGCHGSVSSTQFGSCRGVAMYVARHDDAGGTVPQLLLACVPVCHPALPHTWTTCGATSQP